MHRLLCKPFNFHEALSEVGEVVLLAALLSQQPHLPAVGEAHMLDTAVLTTQPPWYSCTVLHLMTTISVRTSENVLCGSSL